VESIAALEHNAKNMRRTDWSLAGRDRLSMSEMLSGVGDGLARSARKRLLFPLKFCNPEKMIRC
jgi:hypothetical protein